MVDNNNYTEKEPAPASKTNVLGQVVHTGGMDLAEKAREMHEEKKQKKEEKDIATGQQTYVSVFDDLLRTAPMTDYSSGLNLNADTNQPKVYSIINANEVSTILNKYKELDMPYVTKNGEVHAKTKRGENTVNLGLYTPDVDVSNLDIEKYDNIQMSNMYGMEKEIYAIQKANPHLGFEQAAILYFENSPNKLNNLKRTDVDSGPPSPQEKFSAFMYHSEQIATYRAYALSKEGYSPDGMGGYLYQPGEFRSTWFGKLFTQGLISAQRTAASIPDLMKAVKDVGELALVDLPLKLVDKAISGIKGETEEETYKRRQKSIKRLEESKKHLKDMPWGLLGFMNHLPEEGLGEYLYPTTGKSTVLGRFGDTVLDYIDDMAADGALLGFDVNPNEVKDWTEKGRIQMETTGWAGTAGRIIPEYLAFSKTLTYAGIKHGDKLLKKEQTLHKIANREIKQEIKEHGGKIDFLGRRLTRIRVPKKLGVGHVWKIPIFHQKIKRGAQKLSKEMAKDPKRAHKVDTTISSIMGVQHGINVDVLGLEPHSWADMGLQMTSGMIFHSPKMLANGVQRKLQDWVAIQKLKTETPTKDMQWTRLSELPDNLKTLSGIRKKTKAYSDYERELKLSKKILKATDKKAEQISRLTIKEQEEIKIATEVIMKKRKRLLDAFGKNKDGTYKVDIFPSIGDITQLEGLKALEASNLRSSLNLLGTSTKTFQSEAGEVAFYLEETTGKINEALYQMRRLIPKSKNPELANSVIDQLSKIKSNLNIGKKNLLQPISNIDKAVNTINLKTPVKDLDEVLELITSEKLGLTSTLKKDITELVKIEKGVTKTKAPAEKLEEIEELIKGMYVRNKYFDFDTHIRKDSDKFTKKVHKFVDKSYKRVGDEFTKYYKNNDETLDIKQFYDELLPVVQKTDVRIEFFKGKKTLIKGTLNAYLQNVRSSSIDDHLNKNLKGDKPKEFVEDILNKLSDNKIVGFETLIKKSPSEIIKFNKRSLRNAINTLEEKGIISLPYIGRVKDLHSGLSSVLSAARKADSEEVARIYNPIIQTYHKGFLDKTDVGKTLKQVNKLYKQYKVEGWYGGVGKQSITQDQRGLHTLDGDQIITKFIAPIKGGFAASKRDFDLMFPKKVPVITKAGPELDEFGNVFLVDNQTNIDAIDILREGWLRNMAGKDAKFFTLDNLKKYQLSDLWTAKGGGVGIYLVDDKLNPFLRKPIFELENHAKDMALASRRKLNAIKETRKITTKVTTSLKEIIENNTAYKNTVVDKLSVAGSDSERFVTVLTNREFGGGSRWATRQLMKAIDNDTALTIYKKKILKQDIRAVYFDGVVQKSIVKELDGATPDGDALYNIFRTNRNVTKELGFTKHHMQLMDDITDFAVLFGRKGKSHQVLASMPKGLTMEGVLSRVYAIARGVVSARFIISEAILRLMKMRNYGVLKEVIRDERSAELFVNMILRGEPLSPQAVDSWGKMFLRMFSPFKGTREYELMEKAISKNLHIRPLSEEEIEDLNTSELGDPNGVRIWDDVDRLETEKEKQEELSKVE